MSVNIKQNGDLVKVANNISIVQANWNDRGNTSKSTCIRNQPATLKSLDEISANTDTNALAGASAVKEFIGGGAAKVNYNNSLSGMEATTVQGAIDEVNDKVGQLANNQIPEEYLQNAVDEYVAENSAGFATQTDVSQLSEQIYDLRKGALYEQFDVISPMSDSNKINAFRITVINLPTTFSTVSLKINVKSFTNIAKVGLQVGSINESKDVSVGDIVSTVNGDFKNSDEFYLKITCESYNIAKLIVNSISLSVDGNECSFTIANNSYFGTGTYEKVEIESTIELANSVDNLKSSVRNLSVSKVDCPSYDVDISDDIIKFNMDCRLLNDGTLVENKTNWCVSDYIYVGNGADVYGFSGSYTTAPQMAEYDENKNFIRVINSGEDGYYHKTYKRGETEGVSFVRLQSTYGLNEYAYGTYTTFVTNINSMVNIKQPYFDGFKYFQVSVNTSFLPTTIVNSVEDNVVSGDVWCALKLPKSYKQVGTKTKLAVCMHGAGGNVYNGHAGELSGFDYLTNNGYAILDCAGVVGEATTEGSSAHMGGIVAMQSYKKAIEYVIENYNVEETIYLHGHSMGGLSALNFTSMFGNMVKVLGLCYPVTDLYNQAWLNPWYGTRTREQIAEAYNFNDKSGSTYEADKVIGFNPILNNSIVIGENRYNTLQAPIRIWHGNEDNTVSIEGSQALVTALNNMGVFASLRTVDGVAHSYGNAMLPELLNWFNRF